MSAASFSFYQRASSTGYSQYTMSINGTQVGSGNLFVDAVGQDNPLQWTGDQALTTAMNNLTGHVTVVITLSGGAHGAQGTFRMDNFSLNGYTVPTSYSNAAPNLYIHKAGYRYGFNSKENDNEVKGEGDEQDYGMRIYDPRVGRFLSVDPLQKKYADLSSYQFASDRPIDGIDLDGEERTPSGQSLNGPRDNTSVVLYPARPELQRTVTTNATQQLAKAKALQALLNAPVIKPDNRSSQQIQEDQQNAAYNNALQKIYNTDEGNSFQIFSGVGAATIGAIPEVGTAYGVSHGVVTGNKTEVILSLASFGLYKGTSILISNLSKVPSNMATLGEVALGQDVQTMNTYNVVRSGTLPGSQGAYLGATRLTNEQMLALTDLHKVEFAQVYTTGTGVNGKGGFYTLYSGTSNSVNVTVFIIGVFDKPYPSRRYCCSKCS